MTDANKRKMLFVAIFGLVTFFTWYRELQQSDKTRKKHPSVKMLKKPQSGTMSKKPQSGNMGKKPQSGNMSKEPQSGKMGIMDIIKRRHLQKFPHISEKGWEQYMNQFQPDKNDIIICTGGATGTTWLRAICHFLRGGSADFEDIDQVAPWHIYAYDIDFDIMHQRGLRPRLFKSHQFIAAEKRGCKYITVIRNPVDKIMADVSYENKVRGTNETVDEHWKKDCAKKSWHIRSVLIHFEEAYLLRHHPQVLAVCYEDIEKDTRRLLPTIARFMGIQNPSEELLERTLKATSKEQMLIDVSKYDDLWRIKRFEELGRGKGKYRKHQRNPAGAKVVGVTDKEPSKETSNAIMKRADEFLFHTVGVKNYEELQEHIGAAFAMRTKEIEL